jgi:hypothetical protein
MGVTSSCTRMIVFISALALCRAGHLWSIIVLNSLASGFKTTFSSLELCSFEYAPSRLTWMIISLVLSSVRLGHLILPMTTTWLMSCAFLLYPSSCSESCFSPQIMMFESLLLLSFISCDHSELSSSWSTNLAFFSFLSQGCSA